MSHISVSVIVIRGVSESQYIILCQDYSYHLFSEITYGVTVQLKAFTR